MLAEVVSSTSPLRQMMRSLRRREKMSLVCQPPADGFGHEGHGEGGGRGAWGEGVGGWEGREGGQAARGCEAGGVLAEDVGARCAEG